MISKKFFKASFIYTVIGTFPLLSSVILLPFYTNFLNTSDFGLLALYIAFTMFVQILVNVSFDSALVLYYYEYYDNRQKLNEFVSTIATALILLGGIFIILFSVFGNPLFALISKNTNFSFFPFGLMSVMTAICNSFFRTYTSLLIAQEKAESFFWLNTLNFVLTIAISLIGLYAYPHSLIGPMWGRFLSGIGIFVAAAYFLYKEFGFHFKTEFVKKVIPYCTPLLTFNIMSWVLASVDIYIINNFVTVSDVGVFDFAIKCTLLIEFSFNALSSAIAPKIYSIWAKTKINYSTMEVNRYFNAFTAIVIIIIAANIFILPIGVPLIVKKVGYYAAFQFIPFIAVSQVFKSLYMMYISPVYFFKKTKKLLFLYFVIAIIKISLSIVLIKFYGIWGAIAIILLVRTIEPIGLAIINKSIFSFKFNKIKIIFLPVAYMVLVILLEQFIPLFNADLIHFVSLLLVGGTIGWLYKNEIVITVQSLLKK